MDCPPRFATGWAQRVRGEQSAVLFAAETLGPAEELERHDSR